MTLKFSTPQTIPGTPVQDAEAPTVARSGDRIFVLWHEFPPDFDPNNAQPDIFLARSLDNGATFKPRINLSTTRTGASDREVIAVSGSRVYVAWVEDGQVVFRRDKENDGQFANVKTISDPGTVLEAMSDLRIVASGDTVCIAWSADVNGQFEIFVARSTDAGDKFDLENISANAGDSTAPSIVLRSDGKVFAAWKDNSGGNGAEIFFARQQ
ncbi:hypothetical protein [Actinomycetospora sp. CA-053990]|uniref:hypothetical protein n=1 Tax=Actinomycetospora sp. CA-053990 TaxID=3239891 RepID=UPI003D8D7426